MLTLMKWVLVIELLSGLVFGLLWLSERKYHQPTPNDLKSFDRNDS
jgi:hypothetical protein